MLIEARCAVNEIERAKSFNVCWNWPVTTEVRFAGEQDLAAMTEAAVDAQADPERYCAYFGDDASSIASDIVDVVGPAGGDWTSAAWLDLDDEGRIKGWLLAETDHEMSRVWWWGPTITGLDRCPAGQRDRTFDRLLAVAMDALGGYAEHEIVGDERSRCFASLARRHGFVAGAPSAVLRTAPFADARWEGDDDIVALADPHRSPVRELHDALFPGTHTPGVGLVAPVDNRTRLIAEYDRQFTEASDQRVAGYIATEIQGDGSLYIDFLGVALDARGRGFGRRLVSEAMRRGAEAGATHAHLTVRAENRAARRLYASLGFVEERVVVPYRRGFSLD